VSAAKPVNWHAIGDDGKPLPSHAACCPKCGSNNVSHCETVQVTRKIDAVRDDGTVVFRADGQTCWEHPHSAWLECEACGHVRPVFRTLIHDFE